MREANVRTTDRVIEQWGIALPNDRDGCELVPMTEAQELRHDELLALPNGGITLGVDGVLSALPVEPPDPISAEEQSLLDQYSADLALLRTFYTSPSGTATPVQRDEVLKSLMRVVRYLVRRDILG